MYITDRIVLLTLPLPLADLRQINSYAVLGDDGVTLIDPGWATTESEAALIDGLGAIDAGIGDVRQILVTHGHWDHYTLAAKWRADHGIELMLGAGERVSIESFDRLSGVYPAQVEMLVRAGAPELAEAVAQLDWAPYERGIPHGPPDRWVVGGDEIDCGGAVIRVRETPGHTRGHVVYEMDSAGTVFTGDHLLPRITPSIGFERMPEALPLRSYLASLQLFEELPDRRMLPAHGHVAGTTRSRAEELLAHHYDRLSRVGDVVASGATTAHNVAAQLRWTRHDKSLSDLDTIHRMTAVLEVQAHLDLLVFQGKLSAEESGAESVFTAL